MRAFNILWSFVLIAFVMFVALLLFSFNRLEASVISDHTQTWLVYEGAFDTEYETYEVEISEVDRGSGFERIVHLRPTDKPSVGLTGHDYNSDGVWDRVLYCGSHDLIGTHPNGWEFGCNSVIRNGSSWDFEPCPADDGQIEPFSTEAINFAIAELDSAMETIHNQDNLSEVWVWDPGRQKCVQVLGR